MSSYTLSGIIERSFVALSAVECRRSLRPAHKTKQRSVWIRLPRCEQEGSTQNRSPAPAPGPRSQGAGPVLDPEPDEGLS